MIRILTFDENKKNIKSLIIICLMQPTIVVIEFVTLRISPLGSF
jgi:hypothetical protein